MSSRECQNGHCIIYFSDGIKWEEGLMIDDVRHGTWNHYDKTGTIIVGQSIYDHEAGTITEKDFYITGELERYGIRSMEYDETGIWTTYYKSGAIQILTNYEYGYIQGEEKWFYESGPIHKIYTYVDDYMDGPYREYYESGALKVEGNYVQRHKKGIWKEYHENGNLYMIGEIDNDYRIGIWKFYWPDGRFKLEYSYKNKSVCH